MEKKGSAFDNDLNAEIINKDYNIIWVICFSTSHHT